MRECTESPCNTFAAGLIQAVRAQTAGSHVVLCGNISGAVSIRELFTPSKDSAGLVACKEKKIFGLGFCGFFVSAI